MHDKLKDAGHLIESAIAQYNPVAIFSLFSGGHDSLTMTHFVARYLGDRLTGVCHINTGIGIRQTREFVRNICKQFGWRLLEYKATENVKADGTPDPQIYSDIVVEHGFPGPGIHHIMYARLKERQLLRLIRDHKTQWKDKILLLSGARKKESNRRMRNVIGIQKEGARIWVAPFQDFTDTDQQDYMTLFSLPKNPVKEYLCMSGECLCGSFAQPNELKEIELWYPEAAAEIKAIEERARLAGQANHVWGVRPKTERQIELLGGTEFLCATCNYKYDRRNENV